MTYPYPLSLFFVDHTAIGMKVQLVSPAAGFCLTAKCRRLVGYYELEARGVATFSITRNLQKGYSSL